MNPSDQSYKTLRVARKVAGLAAVALVVLMGAQPAAALVCGIIPEPAVIERTIAGRQPMGGEFDVVVLGVVAAIGPTDSEGYRQVDLDVGAVLRGTAPRQYSFGYPASADEPSPMFIGGATYLVAVESEGWAGRPTTSECSATSRVSDLEQFDRYVELSVDPVIYDEAIPVAAEGDLEPVSIVGTLVAVALLLTAAWFAWRPAMRMLVS